MIELMKAMIQPDYPLLAQLKLSHCACGQTHNANAYGAQPEWVASNVAKGELLVGAGITAAHLHLLQRGRMLGASEAGHELQVA